MPAGEAEAVRPTTYVTLSDGTSIAPNVRMPKDLAEGKAYPTIFEMSGYDGGSADGEHPYAGKGSGALTEMFEGDYVFTLRFAAPVARAAASTSSRGGTRWTAAR